MQDRPILSPGFIGPRSAGVDRLSRDAGQQVDILQGARDDPYLPGDDHELGTVYTSAGIVSRRFLERIGESPKPLR